MGAKFKSNKSFSDTNPKTGRPELPKPYELVEFLKMPDNEFVAIRLVGPTFSYATHWIEFHSEKQGKKVRFAKPCLGYSHDTEAFDADACPYCKAGLKASVDYISNAIIRDIQDEYVHKPKKWEKSERKTGFKDKASKSKTPVRVVRFTAATAERIKKRSQANKAKNKDGEVQNYPLSDNKYGKDINYLYNSKGTGTGKYELEIQENTRLTEEEKEYLLWDIENCVKVETKADAKAAVKSLRERQPDIFGEEKSKTANSDGDNDMAKVSDSDISSDSDDDKKKTKAPAKGKGKKAAASSASDNSDSDAATSASDSDEAPAKGKGKKAPAKGKGKKAAKSSDSDASDSDAASDSDEPKKGKGKKAPAKGKGKAKKGSDSDSGSASDSDEPKKGKKAAKGKAKKAVSSADSDSDSDLSDVDSDSDADTKKKGKGKKAPAKGKGKKAASSDASDSDAASDSDD